MGFIHLSYPTLWYEQQMLLYSCPLNWSQLRNCPDKYFVSWCTCFLEMFLHMLHLGWILHLHVAEQWTAQCNSVHYQSPLCWSLPLTTHCWQKTGNEWITVHGKPSMSFSLSEHYRGITILVGSFPGVWASMSLTPREPPTQTYIANNITYHTGLKRSAGFNHASMG